MTDRWTAAEGLALAAHAYLDAQAALRAHQDDFPAVSTVDVLSGYEKVRWNLESALDRAEGALRGALERWDAEVLAARSSLGVITKALVQGIPQDQEERKQQ